MTVTKNLGIWMDHSSAHLIELSNEPMQSTVLESEFTHAEKVHSLHKSEKGMHNKEQHQQAEFYKKLGEIILHHESVLLFGPTDAKTELLNTLLDDHRFNDIKIATKQTERMTENQEHAFVRAYFSGKIHQKQSA
jgi:hypothetical protein